MGSCFTFAGSMSHFDSINILKKCYFPHEWTQSIFFHNVVQTGWIIECLPYFEITFQYQPQIGIETQKMSNWMEPCNYTDQMEYEMFQ